jgi:hypothetical protein
MPRPGAEIKKLMNSRDAVKNLNCGERSLAKV